MMKNERSMLIDDKTSRVLAVAPRFASWKHDDSRLLFLFGPFPTMHGAVDAERCIRRLSGDAVEPSIIKPLMNGVKKDGAGEFVAVPDAMVKQLEDLNLLCGRDCLVDSREVVDMLVTSLKR